MNYGNRLALLHKSNAVAGVHEPPHAPALQDQELAILQ